MTVEYPASTNVRVSPDFIIIGAQKSASSFLQMCLTEHPDVWMPDGETPYFESPDYESQNPADLAAVFADRHETRVGIKRPNYIGKKEVPPRITSDCPNAKLIAVLRNPSDRAMSAYYHQIKSGFLPPTPHEVGIDDLLTNPDAHEKYPRGHEILEFGSYYKHISPYRHFFNRSQILVLLHEDVLSNPQECIKKVYTFLNVDDEFFPINAIKCRPQAVVYQRTRLRILAYRPRLLYRFNARRTRMIGRSNNPLRLLIAWAIVTCDSYILSKVLGNKRPTLSVGLSQKLKNYYRDDIQQLEILLDRDLSEWKS